MTSLRLERIRINQTDLEYENPKWYTGLLGTEEEWDIHEKMAWGKANWTISIYAAIMYLIFIFLGQEFMKNRKPFSLKVPLTLWNFALAAFSIKGASVMIPYIWGSLATRGFHESICGTIDLSHGPSTYWGYLFVLSKIVELGDTAFIILRKRKLIFLHWYHHISVLVVVWVSSVDLMSTGAYFALVNYFIHGIMYAYYALSAMGFRAPKIVAMGITVSQLLQMVVGVWLNGYAFYTKSIEKIDCSVKDFHIWLVFGMYLSYLILFGNFFYRAYLKGNHKSKQKLT